MCLLLVYLTSVHMGFMSDTKNTFTYIHNYLFTNCFRPKQVQKTGLVKEACVVKTVIGNEKLAKTCLTLENR